MSSMNDPIRFLTSLIPELWKSGAMHTDWKLYAQVLTTVFVGCVIIDYYSSWSKLKHIKGPFLAAHSKLWLLRTVSGGRMHEEFYQVCQKYGVLL
jgi:hypothetical protein